MSAHKNYAVETPVHLSNSLFDSKTLLITVATPDLICPAMEATIRCLSCQFQ
ncbi:unnamed protein product [Prunus armeniaca]|uniref:Uncharacterized protein n=1 Tax=Prunus armeniaca TaxID=36596 RepID=A0A6J5WB38_PRUAR|nr:unnamed protein product [Prunus armeniaca]